MDGRPVSAFAIATAAALAVSGCASMHHDAASSGPRRASGAQAVGADRPSAFRGVTGRPPGRAEPRTYLLLRLAERRLYMVTYDTDAETNAPTEIESFPVAIGRKDYQTPTGLFAVTDKLEDPEWVQFDWDDPSRVIRTVPPGPDNPLGRRWIGFAAGYGWQIGFHGTPHPELLGQAVSHGCVRLRNEDVVEVYDRVQVGTVVIVQP